MTDTMKSGAALVARESSMCRPTRNIRTRVGCCLVPDGPPPDRPDLAIYSQAERFAAGQAPSWDSPDILTNYWNPFKLMPEASITVRNLSPTATAANAQVLLHTSPFGIGQVRTQLGAQVVSLAPSQQKTLLFPFTQALLNGPEQRIAVHVRIVHPYDAREIDNAGSQQIADAYCSAMGRSFTVTFPVVNPGPQAQQITLVALPNTLNAVVSPATHLLGPLQQLMASLTLHVPAAVHGTAGAPQRLDATIVGRDAAGNVLDGLTYVIWVDN